MFSADDVFMCVFFEDESVIVVHLQPPPWSVVCFVRRSRAQYSQYRPSKSGGLPGRPTMRMASVIGPSRARTRDPNSFRPCAPTLAEGARSGPNLNVKVASKLKHSLKTYLTNCCITQHHPRRESRYVETSMYMYEGRWGRNRTIVKLDLLKHNNYVSMHLSIS